MIGFIIWIIGLVLTIKAGMEIRKTNGEGGEKNFCSSFKSSLQAGLGWFSIISMPRTG